MSDPLRVAVIGGGAIAQAVHLPALTALEDRFRVVALADPSATVRDALAGRYPGVRMHADWRDALDGGGLDAVIVCSPHATHAEIALAAMDLGLHVFVEKPLCISPEDADAICTRRDATGLTVQVGYMKRYDAGYEALIAGLPENADDLRFVDVVTYDPWLVRPPFVPADLVIGRDVPAETIRQGEESERAQVEQAVGRGDPETVRAFSYTFLACLVHDVNLVHGVLEHLGAAVPAHAVQAGYWADGKAANIGFELVGGVGWQSAWLLLEGLEEFRETASFYFRDEIHRLRFPAPYLRQLPTVYEVSAGVDGRRRETQTEKVADSYRASLEHFHECVTEGVECRTPPEQARLDLLALRDAFLTRAAAEVPAR